MDGSAGLPVQVNLVVRVEWLTTIAGAVRMLLAGEIDAYAANKQRLAVVAADEPGIRVLDGSVLPVEQSIAVNLQNEMGVEYLNAFIDDVRASGFLQEIVESSGLAGVEVAPGMAR